MAARAHKMRELAKKMRYENAQSLVGSTDLVIVQRPGKAVSSGLFDVMINEDIPLDSLVPVHFESVLKDATLKASIITA